MVPGELGKHGLNALNFVLVGLKSEKEIVTALSLIMEGFFVLRTMKRIGIVISMTVQVSNKYSGVGLVKVYFQSIHVFDCKINNGSKGNFHCGRILFSQMKTVCQVLINSLFPF